MTALQIFGIIGGLSVAASVFMCALGLSGLLPVQPYGNIALIMGTLPPLVAVLAILMWMVWKIFA
jgi:hypothetical protein